MMSSRQTAIKNGDIFYEGKPCYEAGHTRRYLKSGMCVVCHKKMNRYRQTVTHIEENKKYKQKSNLKKRYGITPDEWLWMWKEQRGKCKVKGCERTTHDRWWEQGLNVGLEIDHCHKTDRVRGLICHPHNSLFGWIENLELTTLDDFTPAMEYLYG